MALPVACSTSSGGSIARHATIPKCTVCILGLYLMLCSNTTIRIRTFQVFFVTDDRGDYSALNKKTTFYKELLIVGPSMICCGRLGGINRGSLLEFK